MTASCALITLVLFIIQSFHSTNCQVYRDGYAHSMDEMPGSKNDPRNLPSLPFCTDTNRYSDGISSDAMSSVTSPHFPYYDGYYAYTNDRYKYHLDYLKNAGAQGIGIRGDGDAVIEDSKVKITSQKHYSKIPAPSITFPVHAALKWNPSGFAIQQGEMYTINVTGSHKGFGMQFWNDGGIRVDADGYDSYYDPISNCYVAIGRCRPHLRKRRRLPEVNWMALSCAIGQFVRPVFPIIPGDEKNSRYVPIDEAAVQQSAFRVGIELRFLANTTGELICFANDAHSLYWNNFGTLNVTVTRSSWPPKNDTYYQPLYLPACDSATVVYSRGAGEPLHCNPNGGGEGWNPQELRNNNSEYASNL